MNEIVIRGILFQYNSYNIHIVDSYKVPNSDVRKYLVEFCEKTKTSYRTMNSMEKEWIAHNMLYELGLFKSHTKDTDISIYESKERLFMYGVLYLIHKLID